MDFHNLASGSDYDVEVVVLEEKTLARVTCRKRQPEAITAIDSNAGRTEAVAKRFDRDVPRLRQRCPKTGEHYRECCKYQKDQQGGEAPSKELKRVSGGISHQDRIALFLQEQDTSNSALVTQLIGGHDGVNKSATNHSNFSKLFAFVYLSLGRAPALPGDS